MSDLGFKMIGNNNGVAKGIKTDSEGNLYAKIVGEKVLWINHFTNQTITALNNSDPTANAFRDISTFDEVDIYVLCDRPYNFSITMSGNNDMFRSSLPTKINEPATSGKNAKIYSLKNDAGDNLRFDKLNPVILNPSSSQSLVATVMIRGYRKVAR